jgi:hypothetical protein
MLVVYFSFFLPFYSHTRFCLSALNPPYLHCDDLKENNKIKKAGSTAWLFFTFLRKTKERKITLRCKLKKQKMNVYLILNRILIWRKRKRWIYFWIRLLKSSLRVCKTCVWHSTWKLWPAGNIFTRNKSSFVVNSFHLNEIFNYLFN